MMNPIRLSQALRCLKYLKHKVWIDITSIDLWLMSIWELLPVPEARYIPNAFIPPMATDEERVTTDDQEIDMFRAIFDDLPDRGTACPLETLVYVLNCGGNHFCVVVFAPSLGAIYLLGKDILSTKVYNNCQDWTSWNGVKIWTKVCQLMGWTGLPSMVLRKVDWKQNGYDCGPIACQVSQHILINGLKTDGNGQWKRPTILRCGHLLRLKMAEVVHEKVVEGHRKYGVLRTHCLAALQARFGIGEVDGMDMAHDELGNDLQESPIVGLHSVSVNLRPAIRQCKFCQKILEEERHRLAAKQHPIPLMTENVQQALARHRKEVLKGTEMMTDYVQGFLEETDKDENSDDDDESSLSVIQEGQEFEQPEGVEEKGNIRKIDKLQARIGRFPRPVEAPVLPARRHLRGLLLPFDRTFDDYESGPVLEDISPIPVTNFQLAPSLMYICNQILLTPAPYSLFIDYGYRLFPCFAQSFDMGEPILVKEHMCPAGLADPPDSIQGYISQDRKGRYGQEVKVNDLLVVGAEQVLEMAKEHDAILLTGQTDDQYICVDLLRDGIEPDELEFACDIDSLIWITRTARFKGTVSVYSAPVIRDRAPIWKNNHVEIELLYPQSEKDQKALGGRTEWFTKRHSLSTLPHLLLGVQQGSSVVEILIFFPRMMHKDPHRHFHVTRIPKGIQDFFWDHVLLPALDTITPSTR
ncbi:MAG: hypothetical protein QOH50_5252, partial [Kribbellaceae bacterium]|nr:hypothetical protein [Kribbellaceae bacterium]